jgi:GntR family transcriptional regulator
VPEPAPDPASADPRAFRIADADGKPLAAFVGDDGYVWLDVHGELARLDPASAMKFGGRLGGAGKRALSRPLSPDDGQGAVADRLERRIKAGELRGKLPGTAELAARYGVSRGTVGRARRELIARGVVVVSPGLGTFTV